MYNRSFVCSQYTIYIRSEKPFVTLKYILQQQRYQRYWQTLILKLFQTNGSKSASLKALQKLKKVCDIKNHTCPEHEEFMKKLDSEKRKANREKNKKLERFKHDFNLKSFEKQADL